MAKNNFDASVRNLSGNKLLVEAPPEILADIEKKCEWLEYSPGDVVIDLADNSTNVYFVVKGQLKAMDYLSDEHEVALAELNPGDSFGELSAIDLQVRSARVTVRGCPIGRQPCETTDRTGTSSESNTATAPRLVTRASHMRRLPPGPVADDAIPPTISSPGTRALQSTSMSATGNEYGSASSSSVPRAGSASGQPTMFQPSSVLTASSTKPLARPAPNAAAKTDSAGSYSTSREPPAIPAAVRRGV